MGQLHLAPSHLPAALPRWLDDARRPAAAHALPELRGDLRASSSGSLVRSRLPRRVGSDAHSYCLVNSSPLVSQQSYLDWVEATALGERVEEVTPEVHFREAGGLLAEFIEITPPSPLPDVEIASPGNLALFRRLQREEPSRNSGCWSRPDPGRRELLPSASAGGLPGRVVVEPGGRGGRHRYLSLPSARTRTVGRGGWWMPSTRRRSSRRWASSRARSSTPGARPSTGRSCWRPSSIDPASHASIGRPPRRVAGPPEIRGRGAGSGVQQLYTLRDPAQFHAVTRVLGQVLGDKLYYALLRGRIGKAEVRSLFFDAFEEEGQRRCIRICI